MGWDCLRGAVLLGGVGDAGKLDEVSMMPSEPSRRWIPAAHAGNLLGVVPVILLHVGSHAMLMSL